MCADVIQGVDKTRDVQCNLPCFKNRTHACGGKGHFSVYYTGYVQEPEFTQIKEEDIPKVYDSCYEDRTHRTLCPARVTSPRLTVAMCLGMCEDARYRYASLGSPDKCCCGNSLQGADHVTKSLCPLSCRGSTAQPCGGGSGYFSVYLTGVPEILKAQKKPVNPIPDYLWLTPHVNASDVKLIP
ncbi:WSC domain-containing protein ARB_07867 [Aplysia californica]|uniref:WSC domain-containing protein ARB_07867 n=1 Tax=Aplysia californica TaxID=6500 RepID=A0ABM1VQ67_APLCA|nr:WSC domain-containing protein ARB_07867 [Aplysia californica]